MKLGAQLYTLRDYIQNEKDLAFTLKEVRKMGYTEVQVSAIGPIKPEIVKELCDENGLKIAITHTNPDRILHETEKVIEEHEIMGCDYIGIGAMPEKYRRPEWFDHFEDDFKEPAKKIAAAGKLLMYHNHHLEFEKINGVRMLDQLMTAFAPDELGITLDTYWVQAAGENPINIIRQYGNRIPCIHLKDMDVVKGQVVMAPVLEGNMDFVNIMKEIDKVGTIEHLLVEQDVCIGSPFDNLKKSFDNLAKLGYK